MAFDGRWNAMPGVVQGADLSAASAAFKFVKLTSTTTEQVGLCAATTDQPCGVLQASAAQSAVGEPVTVAYDGVVKVQSDGTVQVGNRVATNASGQATPALTTQYIVGTCIATGGAANAGDLITIMLDCKSPSVR